MTIHEIKKISTLETRKTKKQTESIEGQAILLCFVKHGYGSAIKALGYPCNGGSTSLHKGRSWSKFQNSRKIREKTFISTLLPKNM